MGETMLAPLQTRRDSNDPRVHSTARLTAGTVDSAVERAKGLDGLGDRRLDRVLLSGVHLYKDSTLAELLR